MSISLLLSLITTVSVVLAWTSEAFLHRKRRRRNKTCWALRYNVGSGTQRKEKPVFWEEFLPVASDIKSTIRSCLHMYRTFQASKPFMMFFKFFVICITMVRTVRAVSEPAGKAQLCWYNLRPRSKSEDGNALIKGWKEMQGEHTGSTQERETHIVGFEPAIFFYWEIIDDNLDKYYPINKYIKDILKTKSQSGFYLPSLSSSLPACTSLFPLFSSHTLHKNSKCSLNGLHVFRLSFFSLFFF